MTLGRSLPGPSRFDCLWPRNGFWPWSISGSCSLYWDLPNLPPASASTSVQPGSPYPEFYLSEASLIHNFHLQLLGKWYIHYWVGNLPIPENIKASPLPPFTFVKNVIGQLEFRMNILWVPATRQPSLVLDWMFSSHVLWPQLVNPWQLECQESASIVLVASGEANVGFMLICVKGQSLEGLEDFTGFYGRWGSQWWWRAGPLENHVETLSRAWSP